MKTPKGYTQDQIFDIATLYAKTSNRVYIAEWLEKLLVEAQSKLTAEAGGGEKDNSIYGRPYCYGDMKKAWDAGKRNKAQYQETNWIDFDDFLYSLTPPLTTKGKQNAATKEEAVEAKTCWHCGRGIEYYSNGQRKTHCGCGAYEPYRRRWDVAPSAPDKGEEKYMVQIDVDENIRVGKSEGEEAEAILKKWNHGLHNPFEEKYYMDKSSIIAAMQEYAHSSGDRGRKEWPGEEEIKQQAIKLYQTTSVSNQIHRVIRIAC